MRKYNYIILNNIISLVSLDEGVVCLRGHEAGVPGRKPTWSSRWRTDLYHILHRGLNPGLIGENPCNALQMISASDVW